MSIVILLRSNYQNHNSTNKLQELPHILLLLATTPIILEFISWVVYPLSVSFSSVECGIYCLS
ncbi:hypothetical protein VAE122_940005 [Vibrio aestuarianus]|nr:hypothetical protein VAE122_940005 [Vibrio aestuarianus]